MTNLFTRAGIAGALLLCLAQAGGGAASAQQGGGRYGAIGREGNAVLLLDQEQGIIYRCPMDYAGRCIRQSWVQ
jgi:hypothetical protein